jgi:hypothetical protein
MFNTGSGYSLSDIAAVSGRNGGNGFGGDGDGWWIILLFLFALGGWGNGFGGNKGAGGAQDIAYSFDFCQIVRIKLAYSSPPFSLLGWCL